MNIYIYIYVYIVDIVVSHILSYHILDIYYIMNYHISYIHISYTITCHIYHILSHIIYIYIYHILSNIISYTMYLVSLCYIFMAVMSCRGRQGLDTPAGSQCATLSPTGSTAGRGSRHQRQGEAESGAWQGLSGVTGSSGDDVKDIYLYAYIWTFLWCTFMYKKNVTYHVTFTERKNTNNVHIYIYIYIHIYI